MFGYLFSENILYPGNFLPPAPLIGIGKTLTLLIFFII